MQKGKIRNYPEYTHFACLPFVQQAHRTAIQSLQQAIRHIVAEEYDSDAFEESNYLLAHITISMLVLHRQDSRQLITQILLKMQQEIQHLLSDAFVTFRRTSFFTRTNPKTQRKEVTLLYLEIERDEHFRKLERVTDVFIRQMLAAEIIVPA
jgi:hypothetical protein